jgi:hypothetical protein
MFCFWWRGLTLRIALTKEDASVALSARYEQKWDRRSRRQAPNLVLYELPRRPGRRRLFKIYMIDGHHSDNPDHTEFRPLRRAPQLRSLFIDELDADADSRSFLEWLLPAPLERLICSTPASLTRDFFHEVAYAMEISVTLDKWPDTPHLRRPEQPGWKGVTLTHTR